MGEETPETTEDDRPQKEEKREEVELTKQEASRGRGRKNNPEDDQEEIAFLTVGMRNKHSRLESVANTRDLAMCVGN